MSAKTTVQSRLFMIDQLMEAAIHRMREITASMSAAGMEAELDGRPYEARDEGGSGPKHTSTSTKPCR